MDEALDLVGTRLGLSEDERSYSRLLAGHAVADLLVAAEEVLDDRLLSRFRHVVSEAQRTWLAESALRADDRETFGVLMSASHASLRDDYEISGPELDQLVELARDAGAVGARLTGAGMGGCIVALCSPDTVDSVLDALREGYFEQESVGDSPPELNHRLFVAIPSAGASITRL